MVVQKTVGCIDTDIAASAPTLLVERGEGWLPLHAAGDTGEPLLGDQDIDFLLSQHR